MPGQQAGLEKAQIKNLYSDEVIDCMFRPKEYTFTKTNTWSSEEVIGSNVPALTAFSGGAMTLKMDLFFDTYEKGEDVRKYTNKTVSKVPEVPIKRFLFRRLTRLAYIFSLSCLTIRPPSTLRLEPWQ